MAEELILKARARAAEVLAGNADPLDILAAYHQYRNGGIWPFVGGFYVAALVHAGRLAEAERALEQLAELNRLGRERPWGVQRVVPRPDRPPHGLPPPILVGRHVPLRLCRRRAGAGAVLRERRVVRGKGLAACRRERREVAYAARQPAVMSGPRGPLILSLSKDLPPDTRVMLLSSP